jgi:hypothetical protein
MRKTFITVLILALALAWIPRRVEAAIAGVGANTSGSAGNESSSTSIVVAITVQLDANNVGVMVVSSDNLATSAGDTNDHTSVSDSQSQSWTKLGETTQTGGAAADGVTVSVWQRRTGVNLTTSDTVTVNFSAAVVAKCARIYEFTVGNDLQLAGTVQTAQNTGNGYTSVSISGLPSKEYLFFRGLGKESASNTEITPTTNYTVIGTVRSGNNSTNSVFSRGEWRVVTATGETSNPTHTISADSASVFVALEEATGGGAPARRRTVIISEDRDRRRIVA